LIAIRQRYDNLIKGALVNIGAHEGLSIPGADPEFSRGGCSHKLPAGIQRKAK
jgi:hypothetical protein